MTINTYSTSPMWAPPYEIQTVSNVVVSPFDSGDDQANRLSRFPKRTVTLSYHLSRSGRDTLYSFWRGQHGPFKPFWFFDVVSRNWYDEYIGYQGPLPVGSAFTFDFSASSYTNYTDQANSTAITDFPLMPASSIGYSTGDGPFIGADIQFDKVTFTMSTAVGAGTYVISPKTYSATGGWVSTTNSTSYSDGTTGWMGSGDFTFSTPSSNWIISEVNGVNRYWMHFQITSLTTMSVRPIASQVTIDTKTFDLHTRACSSGNVTALYINGSSAISSTAWSFAINGGGGGADRITFGAYNTSGALITSDLSSAYLRIKGRFVDNNFPENQTISTRYECAIKINEVQW